MKTLTDFNQMLLEMDRIQLLPSEQARIAELCEIAFDPGFEEFADLDPFSEEYKCLAIDLYKRVSGRSDYNPEINELAPYLETGPVKDQKYESTALLGDYLTSVGQVLVTLNASPGQHVLEYGAGEGEIALQAASAGCRVTVVDIEARYLKLISASAKARQVEISTVQGEFGHDCGRFDRILFYEAFHHCLDHIEVSQKLRTMLNPGGYVVFAGEPVIGDHNEQWRPSLKYPWGVRLDGLSFRAIRTYGWMELGFDQDYFVEMLMRAGFLVEYHHCSWNPRASAYIARPYAELINFGDSFLLPGAWHIGQIDHRWTGANEVIVPLRAHNGNVEISIKNYGPTPRSFELVSGEHRVSGHLEFNEGQVFTIGATAKISIITEALEDVVSDPRLLGVAVETLRFL
ncbi:MAG: class I SAM-dependent methyltransferase [Pseudomonadota bacterium]